MSDLNVPANPHRLARRTAIVAAVCLAFGIIIAVLWLASTAVMAFAVGIVLAVVLDAGARGLGHILPVGRGIRLGLVMLIVIALVGGALWYGGATLVSQFNDFVNAVKQLVREGHDFLQRSGLLANKQGGIASLLPNAAAILGGATTVVPLAFNALSIAAAILFIGPFLALEPTVYKRVFLNLLPQGSRPRVNQVLDEAAEAMRSWLLGQSISMTLIFLFSLVALLVIGMPYAVLLSVQAGLLTFIPTLGPFVAGIVIVLAGLSHSLTMALYGLITYLLIQFLESNLVTPVVQERTVEMPPALILALQLAAGVLFGFLGLAFVVPLAAAGKTIVYELYVNDYLGGPWEDGQEQNPGWIARFLDRFLPKRHDKPSVDADAGRPSPEGWRKQRR